MSWLKSAEALLQAVDRTASRTAASIGPRSRVEGKNMRIVGLQQGPKRVQRTTLRVRRALLFMGYQPYCCIFVRRGR